MSTAVHATRARVALAVFPARHVTADVPAPCGRGMSPIPPKTGGGKADGGWCVIPDWGPSARSWIAWSPLQRPLISRLGQLGHPQSSADFLSQFVKLSQRVVD